MKESWMTTTSAGWWRNLGWLQPQQGDEGILDDYNLSRRNLEWLLPQQDDEGILDDFYLNGMMKESWMITTSTGWWRNLVWLLPQRDDEGILDDYYLKRKWRNLWRLLLQKVMTFIFWLTFSWKRQNISCMQCHDVWNAWCSQNKWDRVVCTLSCM